MEASEPNLRPVGLKPRDRNVSRCVRAIIVNYCAPSETSDLALRLRELDCDDIVVVDNGPKPFPIPNCRMISRPDNPGYGVAANLGSKDSDRDYLLIANPDIMLPDQNALRGLVEVLQADPDVAVVGPQLSSVDQNGIAVPYPTGRAFPSLRRVAGNRLLRRVWPNNPFTADYLRPESSTSLRDVDWVSGAFMLVRRTAFLQVGGFDDAYHLFFEDVDLCWRLKEAGWRVQLAPAWTVHHGLGTSRRERPVRSLASHYRSLMRWEMRQSNGYIWWVFAPTVIGFAAAVHLSAVAARSAGRSLMRTARLRSRPMAET